MANYGAILILFLAAGAIAGIFLFLATVIGPRSMNSRKVLPFECGNRPLGPIVRQISVKFYLVALLFIAFDLETVFLYPCAVAFRDLGWAGFWMMFTFVTVLGLGLVYVWRKGALDWE